MNSNLVAEARLKDSRLTVQASLPDAFRNCAVGPALETPDYFQMSMRDKGGTGLQVGNGPWTGMSAAEELFPVAWRARDKVSPS